MHYTKNNYLKIYTNKFGAGLFEYSSCTEDIVMSWDKETLNTAKLISEELKDEKIVLLCSSGADSTIMLKCFMKLKVSFTVAFGIYNFGSKHFINYHDVEPQMTFCKENGIEYKTYTLDVKEFWKPKNLFKYTEPYLQPSPDYAVLQWIMEQVIEDGGIPLFAGGDPVFKPWAAGNTQTVHRIKYADFALHQFLEKNNIKGTIWFYCYTPEQTLAYINDVISNRTLARQKNITGSSPKFYVYEKYYPLISKKNYTGFEYVMKANEHSRRLLTNRYAKNHWQILVIDLIKCLEKPNAS